MSPDDLARVAVVVDRATAHPDLASRFYARLFEEAPETRAMFGDLESQEMKLAEELTTLLALLGDMATLEPRAVDLGRRHRGYGVRATHYRLAQRLLREVLEELLGDAFGEAEADSWSRATTLVTELMQS
ncbi:MAG: hypothetical protein KDA97_06795 [Acidimicrobiales bacterium]|nr:hypothetical protein [Acidimicrobiales bacterium]